MLTWSTKNKMGLCQIALLLLTSFIVFFYSFEDLWEYKIPVLYIITGFIGVLVVLGCIAGRGRYRNHDTSLWFLFFFFGLISTIYNQGISFEYVLSHFICVWMAYLAMYYSAQAADDPHKLIYVSCAVSTVPISVLSVVALIKASRNLMLEFPVLDKKYGCFQLGRLCAAGNANVMGIATATLIIVAGFCVLHSKGLLRIVFCFAVILGWFCLGLTGCRTTMVGIAFSAGILTFLMIYEDRKLLKTDKRGLRISAAFIGALLLFFIVLKSFVIPVNAYKVGMGFYGSLTNQEFLSDNLEKLVVRRISDDDGTLTDRTIIWKSTLEQSVSSTGQFLLGISPISKETIKGVYSGRHDIQVAHAHNIYIEIMRKHGALGIMTIIMLIVIWVKNGIKVLRRSDEKISIRFLVGASFGILLMGMAEPIPLSYISCSYAAVPFFITCGYVYAEGRRMDKDSRRSLR